MKLTGKWYLKKTVFGYKVMAEVTSEHTYKSYYRKATRDDINNLEINCN